jgi:hypothetical protein
VLVNAIWARREKFFAIKGVATACEAPRLYHIVVDAVAANRRRTAIWDDRET